MFGKILYITENIAHVENIVADDQEADLMNTNVVFEAPDQEILGEVEEVNDKEIIIRFLGEFVNGKYLSGILRKPVLNSKLRMINDAELKELVGTYSDKTFKIGESAIYKGYTICADINNLLANHMAIFGNTGSGKSCGVSRLVQNIFGNENRVSSNANIFIFDAYGEYKTAFTELGKYNPNYCYKFVTTVPSDPDDFEMHIPFHLLTLDDLTIFLQAEHHSQLPIIERSLKLTKIFSKNDETAARYKNHLIARALMAILYSNQITANKKNEIFKIIEVCHTPEFNFDSQIQGLGYTRNFSECLEIDSNGNFGENVLITNYILSYIDEKLEMTEEPENPYYTINDFAKAMEFTLISEGFQNNEQLYGDAILLKVRLNSIINSKVAKMYEYPEYVSVNDYITKLVIKNDKKAQIINMNMEDIDDVHAKAAVKILSRIFFEYCKGRKERASMPIHIFLEEAHRYVQKDSDTFLIGYNIFDRIAKEGRKYGILLNIISQRPVDISDTVIAQCSNFLIFKMTHPRDIDYIKKMLPNISGDVVEKQKSLQPGSCVAFGSAFKLPMIIKMEMPNPTPYSASCDVSLRWSDGSAPVKHTEVAPPPEMNMVSNPQQISTAETHTELPINNITIPDNNQSSQNNTEIPIQDITVPDSIQPTTIDPIIPDKKADIQDDVPRLQTVELESDQSNSINTPQLEQVQIESSNNSPKSSPQLQQVSLESSSNNANVQNLGQATNTKDYINKFLMASPQELANAHDDGFMTIPSEIPNQTFNFANSNPLNSNNSVFAPLSDVTEQL